MHATNCITSSFFFFFFWDTSWRLGANGFWFAWWDVGLGRGLGYQYLCCTHIESAMFPCLLNLWFTLLKWDITMCARRWQLCVVLLVFSIDDTYVKRKTIKRARPKDPLRRFSLFSYYFLTDFPLFVLSSWNSNTSTNVAIPFLLCSVKSII